MNPAVIPDRLVMHVPGVSEAECRIAALEAVSIAKSIAPKLSGRSAARLEPLFAEGLFGVRWLDSHVWFQEQGIKPFTMTKLAGKTIPMWIDDPTGTERARNPKLRSRITASGKVQVLIFRRAARMGQRKLVQRGATLVDVPASYPGAPGRIAAREARQPYTTPGKVGGQIARNNVGVRWRHPGIAPRQHIAHSIQQAANRVGLPLGPVIAGTAAA